MQVAPGENAKTGSMETENYVFTPCLKKTVKIVFVITLSNFHQL